MKRYIINWMLLGIVSLGIFSSCEDYDFKDIPDPVVPEDMTPGLKLMNDEILIDAFGNAQGFELRAIGGKWSVEPEKETDWLLDYEPKSGDEGNAVVGITLRVNEGMEERFCRLIVRQENTGAVDTVYVRQFTYESKYTRKTDSLAMIAVYNGLNGEDWMNQWNFKKPMTEWTGVTLEEVNGELRVVRLSLNDFSLGGGLVAEIGNLRELKSLKVGGMKTVSKCPNSLINLRKLETFDVNFSDGTEWFLPNDMSSMLSLKVFKPAKLKIPIESFAGFYTLPALEELYLTTVYLLGKLPSGIASLKNLKTLSLAGTYIYSLPDDIGELAENLTTLNLSGCKALASLDGGLTELVNLTSLNLSSCSVLRTLPEGFGNLTKLTTLDLGNCEWLESLSSDFGNLQINTLNLRGCKLLKSLPESFGQLTKLTKLNFYDCTSLEALPESIGNLTGVTEIDLSNCAALTSLPDGIGQLTGLKKLTMPYTGLTQLPAVVSALSGLEELNLTGSSGKPGISGVAADVFSGLTKLKKLEASYNSFSGGLAWLKNLTALQTLRMENNQLSGEMNLSDFGSALTDVYLNNNRLEGTLNGISGMTKLRNCYMNNNLLSGTLPAELGDCTALTYLSLNNNNITGSIPVELTKMNLGYSGLQVKNNRLSGEIPEEVLSSAVWKKLYPKDNIYPQQEGYGFTNVP